MLTERFKTRLEHEVDSRSVGLGVWLYRRTRGRITRLWHRRAIVLTTTGRRSGRARTVLVQVFEDGGDLFVVAANSGLSRPPGWFFNLMAEPRVLAELDGEELRLRAERLDDTEAAQRWHQLVLAVAPDYEKYARRTGGVPPIFRLVPGRRVERSSFLERRWSPSAVPRSSGAERHLGPTGGSWQDAV